LEGHSFLNVSQSVDNADFLGASLGDGDGGLMEGPYTPITTEDREISILTDLDADKAKRTDSKSGSGVSTPRNGAASPLVKEEATSRGGKSRPGFATHLCST
jgi:hypothetical protein